LLICVLLMISCGKEEVEPITFLTQGKWVLESEKPEYGTETPATKRETLQFNTNGTFVTESYLKAVILPYAADSTSLKLTGKWSVKDYYLTFSNEILSIPQANGQDSVVNNVKAVIQGETIGSYYGFLYGHGYQAGNPYVDTIEVKIGNVFYMGDPNIVIPDSTGSWIMELNENKLVLRYNNKTRTYYNE